MAIDLFTNQASTTVASGGTTAPAQGTTETWVVASSSSFPAISGSQQFHVADPASSATAAEIIAVTAVSGTTWTVTRGAESTAPVVHAVNFTVQQVITAASLNQIMPLSGSTMTGFLAPAVATLTYGTTVNVNAQLANVFALTLTASTATIANPTNPVDGQVIRFRITQDATGGRTVSWGTAYDWGSVSGSPNSAPALTATPSKADIVGFEYVAALSKWCYLGSTFPQGF